MADNGWLEDVPEDLASLMIYHSDRTIAKLAGFIIRGRLIDTINNMEIQQLDHKKFILDLADFHSKNAISLESEPLLVDAMIDHCQFLISDWSAWTDVLMDPELSRDIALIVAKMLTACIWITSAGFVPRLRQKAMGVNYELETCPLKHEAMTVHFVNVFPQLVDAHRSTSILEVITMIPSFFIVNKERNLEHIFKVFEDLFVTTDNKYIDYQISQFFLHVSKVMLDPPEWYSRVLLRQKEYAEELVFQFQVVFGQWYRHNFEESPFYNYGTLCFYLNKINHLSNISDPLADALKPAYYAIDGLLKLLNHDLLKDPSNYRVANLLSSLFFFSAMKTKIYMQQCLNEDNIEEFISSSDWTNVNHGIELISMMMDPDHPVFVRKFNYMLYTEILINFTEMIKSSPLMKDIKLKTPSTEDKVMLAEILHLSVPIHVLPDEVDEEGCKQRLGNFCKLLQLQILEHFYVGCICFYFSFHKEKTLYNPILKKTIGILLKDRKFGLLVAGIMLEFIKTMYWHGQGLVNYEEVATGMLAILPRKSVNMYKPLFHFVKKGIDFAAQYNTNFLPVLSKFAMRLHRSKAETILTYFRKQLHEWAGHPHYKNFEQVLEEMVRGKLPEPPEVPVNAHPEQCLCCLLRE